MDAALLDGTCCVRLHTLLHVVAQCLKPVKLLANWKRTQQLPTLLGQQCWELLRPFARSFMQHHFEIHFVLELSRTALLGCRLASSLLIGRRKILS